MAIFGSALVPMTREGRIDFDKLKQEVEVLEGLNVFHKVRDDSIQKTGQQEAITRMRAADENFWAGIQAEIEENPDKLLYCPIFDSSCETGFLSRNYYSETVRHLNDAIDLDLTNPSFYLKRSAALAKLKLFERAMPDAEAYVEMRPDSPSGHCLKGVCCHGLGDLNSAVTAFRTGLQFSAIAYWDSSRVWSTGADLLRALDATADNLQETIESARTANRQGLVWLELREHGQAILRLHEATSLAARAVGKGHLSYAACVNNLAACLESMGNYRDAMARYQEALRITEVAVAGELHVFLISARHLPQTCPTGAWVQGRWVPSPDERTCNPYVRVELLERGAATAARESRTVAGACQPKWEQVLRFGPPSADCELVLTLLSRKPAALALPAARDDASRRAALLAAAVADTELRLAEAEAAASAAAAAAAAATTAAAETRSGSSAAKAMAAEGVEAQSRAAAVAAEAAATEATAAAAAVLLQGWRGSSGGCERSWLQRGTRRGTWSGRRRALRRGAGWRTGWWGGARYRCCGWRRSCGGGTARRCSSG